MTLINLGSGQRKFPKPWINVDCQERYDPDVLADGANLSMFENEAAEVIVLHHVLEHFGCGESATMLRECWRVLRPGGSLLVFVPDMRALAQRWLTRQMDDQLYLTNVYGAYHGDEADRHKWGFTRDSLRDFLKTVAQWSRVKDFDWRNVFDADLARDWWILSQEAVK